MVRRWWRWVQGLAGLAIVGYAVRFLALNWEQLRSANLAWRIRPLLLLASLLLVLATYAMLVEAWRRMVASWSIRLAWWPAARVWVLSSMGKYLPGKLWTLAGIAVMGKGIGVPAVVATGSALVLQIVSIGTGAAMVAATGAAAMERATPGTWVALAGLMAAAAACLAFVLQPQLWSWLLRRLGPAAEGMGQPAISTVLLGLVANGLAWVVYGLALCWLAAGLFASPRLGLADSIAAFTASYLAGFLFLLAPGGLGVRESVFVLLTQSTLGPSQALALAAASRIGMTLADLLVAAPFVLHRGDRGVTT